MYNVSLCFHVYTISPLIKFKENFLLGWNKMTVFYITLVQSVLYFLLYFLLFISTSIQHFKYVSFLRFVCMFKGIETKINNFHVIALDFQLGHCAAKADCKLKQLGGQSTLAQTLQLQSSRSVSGPVCKLTFNKEELRIALVAHPETKTQTLGSVLSVTHPAVANRSSYTPFI